MPQRFEVITDKVGRIEQYMPAGAPETRLSPEAVGAYLDGGERVTFHGREYDLTPAGNLIHPDVEVPDTVTLGQGVRIDPGTTFRQGIAELPGAVVGDRTRIKETAMQAGVLIGRHALILAQTLGPHTVIGDHARLGQGVEVQARSRIGRSVRIDRSAHIYGDVVIEDGARLGFKTIVCAGARIGERAQIGVFTGAGPRGINQSGPFIRPGQVVEPRAVIRH